MKSNYVLMLVILVIVLVGGYMVFGRSTSNTMLSPTTSPTSTPVTLEPSPISKAPIVIALQTQNNLKQSGVATITENAAGKAVVSLALTGGTFPDPQPAHIHVGVCPKPGAVKYPLANVVNGASETILPVSLAELYNSSEPLALNIHKSVAESSVYTACGDLPTLGSAGLTPDTSMTPKTTTSPVPSGSAMPGTVQY